jgi:hypothetical protein
MTSSNPGASAILQPVERGNRAGRWRWGAYGLVAAGAVATVVAIVAWQELCREGTHKRSRRPFWDWLPAEPG